MRMAEITYYQTLWSGLELVLMQNSRLSYPQHNHISVYTVCMLLSGRVCFYRQNRRMEQEENSIWVIRPYEPHCFTAQGMYTMLTVCIPKEWVGHRDMETLACVLEPALGQMCRECGLEEERRKVLFAQVLLLLMQTSVLTVQPFSSAVQQLCDTMENHAEKPLCLDDMAMQTHFSKYHLLRLFKQEVGLTPHQFQLQNRIRKAQKQILCCTSMAEVALDAGFCDQSHFIRQFEKLLGLSPTRYRCACRTLPFADLNECRKEFGE